MTINHLVADYGYAAVFVLVAIESLGVPLPGETALIAAAAYAGAHSGSTGHHAHLDVWIIFLVGASAAIIGDTVGYWIGDKGGFRLVRRYGRYVRFDEPKVKVARYLFDRHGGAVVFFGRFVSVLRTYAAFLAGTTRMRYRRFLLFNASGGILWAAIYTFAAYYASAALSRVSSDATIYVVVVVVVVIVVGIVLVRRHFSALQGAAEEAYPGPLYDDAGGGAGGYAHAHARPAADGQTRGTVRNGDETTAADGRGHDASGGGAGRGAGEPGHSAR